MKVIEEPRQAMTDVPDAEALIKEARQRQRKRRIFVGIVVLVVALASGIWVASRRRSNAFTTVVLRAQNPCP